MWSARLPEPVNRARITGGAVRVTFGLLTRVLDLVTGQERFTSDLKDEWLCWSGTPTPRARISKGVLLVEGAEVRPEVALNAPCVISPEGDRLAFKDQGGIVRLWDMKSGRELSSRPAPDAQEIAFTAHGVALVRSGSLQLFGGAEGDFSMELPGRSASGFGVMSDGRVLAVSADGERVVVDSPTLNRAEVVDLRDRVACHAGRPRRPELRVRPTGRSLRLGAVGRANRSPGTFAGRPRARSLFSSRLVYRTGARFLRREVEARGLRWKTER
jgi:hypothetical protein